MKLSDVKNKLLELRKKQEEVKAIRDKIDENVDIVRWYAYYQNDLKTVALIAINDNGKYMQTTSSSYGHDDAASKLADKLGVNLTGNFYGEDFKKEGYTLVHLMNPLHYDSILVSLPDDLSSSQIEYLKEIQEQIDEYNKEAKIPLTIEYQYKDIYDKTDNINNILENIENKISK